MEESTVERAAKNKAVRRYLYKQDIPAAFESILTGLAVEKPENVKAYVLDKLKQIKDHSGLLDWDMFVPPEKRPPVRIRPYWLMPMEDDELVPTDEMYDKAARFRLKICSPLLRAWFQECLRKREERAHLNRCMSIAEITHRRVLQQRTLKAWVLWHQHNNMRRLKALNIAMEKSEAKTKRVVFAAWLQYAREASKASKWFKSQRASAQEELAMLKISDALGALPYVLRLKIFSYLDVQSLSASAMVSRTWQEVALDASLWTSIKLRAVGSRVSGEFLSALIKRYRTYVSEVDCTGCVRIPDMSLSEIGDCNNAHTVELAECCLLRDKAVSVIAAGCNSLLSLDLSSCGISDVALRYLSMHCVFLETLKLAYCEQLTDQGAEYLVSDQGCQRLESLDISGCTRIGDPGINFIAEGCKRLSTLLLNDMPQLTNKSLKAVSTGCTGLRHLELSEARNFRDGGLKCLSALTSLTTLTISDNRAACSKGFKGALKSLKSLRTVVLSQCSGVDSGVLALLANVPLESLDICGCASVTDAGLKSLLESGKASRTLRSLDTSLCSGITDAGYLSVLRAVKLERLVMRGCPGASDLSLERIACMPHLRHLDLCGCSRLGESTLRALGKATSLNFLDISNCPGADHVAHKSLTYDQGVNDNGLEYMCKGCPDLKQLNLSHCTEATDEGFMQIGFGFRHLTHLNVAYCEGITDRTLEALSAGCVQLVTAHLFGVTSISDRGLKTFVSQCQALHSLSLESGFAISVDTVQRLVQGRPGLSIHFDYDAPAAPDFISFDEC